VKLLTGELGAGPKPDVVERRTLREPRGRQAEHLARARPVCTGRGERFASGLYGGGAACVRFVRGGRVKPLTRLAGYATLSPSSSTRTTRGGPAPFDPLGPLESLLWRGTSCPSGSVKSLSIGPWSSSHSSSTLVASSGCEGSGGG
jgi:hypothetical protein